MQMYNKLQFVLRSSSIEVSKSWLISHHRSMYVYNKTYGQDIHPGVTHFLRAKVEPVVFHFRCFRFMKMHIPFQWTIFKDFSVFMLDFAGDG